VENAIRYLREHHDEHLKWAEELCRIPSISTQDEHKGDVRRAVEWVRDLCEKIGFKAQIHDTARHPILYAEWCQVPGAPTYLAYGHVDVQPAGDLSLWNADPFEPTIRGDWLICRGAADDKGQMLMYLRAAQAWLETAGKLPINLKLLIEAEEEIGSPNLTPFVQKRKDLLACDGILISDTGLYRDGWPTITTGTRGLVYKEVRISGPQHDVHSGSGGPVVNPANVLAKLIASLHDERGRVAIPGFYDDVVEPAVEERAALAKLPFDEKQFAEELGVPGFGAGEKGWSILELGTVRPTLDVNGIFGGYMQPGTNTIIPASAGAKISMRLVPNQDAEEISRQFDEAVRARMPASVSVEIMDHTHAYPYVTLIEGELVRAAREALRAAFGHDVAYLRCGGTLPILPMFKRELAADSLLLGFASPTCNAHGPNEKVNLGDLNRGAEAVVRLMGYLGG
jgi:acetylornithine deacetylase/succinyl-diaminopimelate desuccinylase-like protein